jgi:hypothetical protein
MRFELILGILFVASIALLSSASAEPEVLMVNVSPGSIDNQVDEEVNFDADCTVCTEEQLEYFYWNSSIDGVLASDSNLFNLNFAMSSTLFSEGDHNITLQVKGNGSWSEINDNSTAVLSVTGDDGKESGITVNFEITPPSIHLGEIARFESCTTMQPDPQPCVEDLSPNLSFDWTIQWNGDGNWSYLGDSEAFESNQFQEGNHNVRLIITDNSNDDVSLPSIKELLVLPAIPILDVEGPDQLSIKEGEELVITSSCLDNNFEEIECSYEWEIWEDKQGGSLLFRLDTQNLTLANLTEEVHMYDLMGRALDEFGTYSSWAHVFITVNPPNKSPQASIDISPDSLGGLTPEYYQYSNLTFGSSNSNDPDGQIIAYKWWQNNEVVSEESTWISSFSALSIYQIKLEVMDDNGLWSTKVSANFKIVENTPPQVSFDVSSDGMSYNFNSTVRDTEGRVVSFEWFVNDEFISSDKNTTWLANASGTYEITLMVMDDGGLWSNATQSIEVVLSVSEQKNFVVSFSSKNIEPGDSFTMDFSKTTGEVNHYEVVVNNPNGSRDSYKITIPTADDYKYTLMFPVKGVYALDITVIWEDGIVQDNMADFYGPTVNVGGDGNETPDEKPLDEVEDSGLPSISVFITLLITSLIAISRRQR